LPGACEVAAMAKGQQKKETHNKPKLSIHEKQAKKLAKKQAKQAGGGA
jgi:hypothetical protein